MRPAISFLKSKNFQFFVKKKFSPLYPDRGIYPDWYLSPAWLCQQRSVGVFPPLQQWCILRPILWINFYAPGSNDWGHIVFVLSVCLFCPICLFVCLSVVNFILRYNFWTVRDRSRLHILYAYSTNDALSNVTKVNDLMTLNMLTLTLKVIIAVGLCCCRCFTNTPWFFLLKFYGFLWIVIKHWPYASLAGGNKVDMFE